MGLKKEISDQIKDLLQKNPQGLIITEIVKAININRNTADLDKSPRIGTGGVAPSWGWRKSTGSSQRVPAFCSFIDILRESVVQAGQPPADRLSPMNRFAGLPELIQQKSGRKKNIEYTPVALVFDELFTGFIERIREGIAGYEMVG